MRHLQGAWELDGLAPRHLLVRRRDRVHAVAARPLHVVRALVEPDVDRAVAVAEHSAEERDVALRARAEVLCPEVAVAAFVVDGRTRIGPVVARDVAVGIRDERRRPLDAPPRVPRARGDIRRRERGAPAELVRPARHRAASGHGRVVDVLLVRRERMAVGVRAVNALRHGDPRVVGGAVEVVRAVSLVVEVVVRLLRERPHHGVRAEARHPVARESVKRGGVVGELPVHRRGEEELGVCMYETLVGEIPVVAVGKTETRNVGRVYPAVRDVELRSDGLGLEDGEALGHAPVDDVLKVGSRARSARVRAGFVDLLLIKPPVRIAEIEKRRAICVDEVLRALRGLHETASVDFEVASVGSGLYRAGLAVERGVAPAGGGPGPATGFRRGEAHAKDPAAVPEAGTRHLLAGLVREQGVEYHAVRTGGVVVRARLKGKFRFAPCFCSRNGRGARAC